MWSRVPRSFVLCLALWVLCTLGAMMFATLILAGRGERESRSALLRSEYRLLAHTFNLRQEQHFADTATKWELQDGYIPIVVYVCDRPLYFQQFLSSLRNVTDIHKTLLVVSHDCSSETMFNLSSSISFMPVLELMHVGKRGGTASEGERQEQVSHTQRKAEEVVEKRERPSVLSIKRHWWWVMKYVYERLPTVAREKGPLPSKWALFVEEDVIVSRDLLQATQKLASSMSLCTAPCWGFSLADRFSSALASSSLPESLLVPRKGLSASEGYAWTRETWTQLKSEQEKFWSCTDGWDMCIRLLQHQHKLPSNYLATRLPRVKNIGIKGVNVNIHVYHALGLGDVVLNTRVNPDLPFELQEEETD